MYGILENLNKTYYRMNEKKMLPVELDRKRRYKKIEFVKKGE